MKKKRIDTGLEVVHKSWCALVIAMNSELPWKVKCDCQPKLQVAPINH